MSQRLQQWRAEQWRTAQQRHEARVDGWTADWLYRRDRGQAHPVEDFLLTYYPIRPARLRRWHPGAGVLLRGDDSARGSWRFYSRVEDGTTVDLEAFRIARGPAVRETIALLSATADRTGQFTCFGLHEWAMVYRLAPEALRHSRWPLRLGTQETDAVVEAHQLRCSHFDAFRFFTAAAAPRNTVALSRARQADHEQPACLHAAMDLYRWAATLAPAVPSQLTADCFELARTARELDMRASPYDLTALGYPPICIETPDGKSEYVAGQRQIAQRAAVLRTQLVQTLTRILHDAAPPAEG